MSANSYHGERCVQASTSSYVRHRENAGQMAARAAHCRQSDMSHPPPCIKHSGLDLPRGATQALHRDSGYLTLQAYLQLHTAAAFTNHAEATVGQEDPLLPRAVKTALY